MNDRMLIKVGLAAGMFSVLLVCAIIYDVVMREVHSRAVTEELGSLQQTKTELLIQQKQFVKAFKDQGDVLASQSQLIMDQARALQEVKDLIATFKQENKVGQDKISKAIKKPSMTIVKEKTIVVPTIIQKGITPPPPASHGLFH